MCINNTIKSLVASKGAKVKRFSICSYSECMLAVHAAQRTGFTTLYNECVKGPVLLNADLFNTTNVSEVVVYCINGLDKVVLFR